MPRTHQSLTMVSVAGRCGAWRAGFEGLAQWGEGEAVSRVFERTPRCERVRMRR
jgi:hypothetical protein